MSGLRPHIVAGFTIKRRFGCALRGHATVANKLRDYAEQPPSVNRGLGMV